jgi:outer membrane receptor protein involved in Fe transport
VSTSRRLGLSILVALTAAPFAVVAEETDAPAGAPVDEQQQAASASGQQVFQGAITITDSPILEGNEVDRYGSVVAKVSERQLGDLYAQDLSAALRRVPGVVISRYNVIGAFGGGDGGAIFIRGHGSGRPGAEIAALTDGVPRFVGIWTHPLLDLLSVDYMSSVQVYRSAQPVLLGNMAFGAVEMTTKRRSERGSGGRFAGSYGTHDTVIGELEYGGRSERLDYYLTASHRQSDGHRVDSDGTVQALSGRIGYRLSDAWDLSVLLQHTEGDVNDPGVEGLPPPPVTENYATNGDFALAELRHGHGVWSGHVKLYLDQLDADWLQWSGEQFTTVTESRNYGVRVRETVDHVEVGWLAAVSENLRLDISVCRDEVDNALRFVPPPPPPPQFANVGAYDVQGVEVSLRADLTDRLSLFVGGTYDDPDPEDVANLPKTTAVGGMSWIAASDLRLNLDAEWVDRRFILNPRFAPGQADVDGHLLVNGRVGPPLRWLGLDAGGEIFVAGQNLADQEYEYRIGYPMPGRTLSLGADIGF